MYLSRRINYPKMSYLSTCSSIIIDLEPSKHMVTCPGSFHTLIYEFTLWHLELALCLVICSILSPHHNVNSSKHVFLIDITIIDIDDCDMLLLQPSDIMKYCYWRLLISLWWWCVYWSKASWDSVYWDHNIRGPSGDSENIQIKVINTMYL